MEVTEKGLRAQYETLETEELIELYRKGGLTELVSSVLAQTLRDRGIFLENLAKQHTIEAKEADTSQDDISLSVLDLIDYTKQWESLDTDELIEMYKNSELDELALLSLIQFLEERGISPETLGEPYYEKADYDSSDDFVFIYKTAKTPSIKAVVLTSLIYFFSSFVIHFSIAFWCVAFGIPLEKAQSYGIMEFAELLFLIIITILLMKAYSGYLFSGSWKINFYNNLKTGLKWSTLFIFVISISVLDPENRAALIKNYFLQNGFSQDNITIIIVILTSATTLVATFLEELIFRGMIQQYINKIVTPRISVLITAGIFTLIHLPNFFFIPVDPVGHAASLFILGIFTGFAFNKANSCISSFIPHLVFNMKYIIIVPLMLTF